jgi:hypothetical protein
MKVSLAKMHILMKKENCNFIHDAGAISTTPAPLFFMETIRTIVLGGIQSKPLLI